MPLLRARAAVRPIGAVVAALLVIQLALGATAVLTRLPLLVVVAHNAVAALLLVALVTAVWALVARLPA